MEKPFHLPGSTEKFFFFISGIIISIPFTVFFGTLARLSIPFSSMTTSFISSVFIAPVVEEFAKIYPLLYRHGESKKSIFILASLVGLGFGISEFFIFVLLYQTPVLLRLPAIFFHAASVSIVAYGITVNRTKRYYLLAVFLHFMNNFLVSLSTFTWLVFGTSNLLLTYLLSIKFYIRLGREKD